MSGIVAPAQGVWPKTALRQGRYFTYASAGSSSPTQQIENLGQLLGLRSFTVTETRKRPFQNGFDTAELLFSFTDKQGRSCEGWAWSAVNNSFGRNNTYTEIAWTPVAAWRRDAQFMVATARLVSVRNPQQAFQRDQLIRNHIQAGPGSAGGFNHPNTFTPYSNQAAMDRISDRNARARRDDYPLVDPSTGRTYHGSSDNYDYVRGGWVNPNDRTQLLKVVPPGQ